MKKLLQIAVFTLCIVLIVNHLDDIAERVGFVSLNEETILQNNEQHKVNCKLQGWGWLDTLSLENKYQGCINDYQKQGYVIVAPLTHEEKVRVVSKG